MYSYDRTAADDDTKAAIKWHKAERKKVIDKHLKAMRKDLEAVMKEGMDKFPNMDGLELTDALRKAEQKIRENLQG